MSNSAAAIYYYSCLFGAFLLSFIFSVNERANFGCSSVYSSKRFLLSTSFIVLCMVSFTGSLSDMASATFLLISVILYFGSWFIASSTSYSIWGPLPEIITFRVTSKLLQASRTWEFVSFRMRVTSFSFKVLKIATAVSYSQFFIATNTAFSITSYLTRGFLCPTTT